MERDCFLKQEDSGLKTMLPYEGGQVLQAFWTRIFSPER